MSLRHALILLALLLAAPRPAAGARFVFTGVVALPGGRPVAGARVALEGVPGAAVATDAEGRFTLACDAAAPARLVLRASHRGWRLALPSGASALAVELRRAPDAPLARLEVRANDPVVARAVAVALGAGDDAVVALEARFTRLVGREDRAAPALEALEVVTPPAPAAAPVAVDVPVAAPVRPEALRLFPSAPEPGSAPASPPPPAVPVAAPGAVVPAAADTAPPPVADTAWAATPAPVATPAPPALPVPVAVPADTAVRPGFRVSVRPESVAAAVADPVAVASPLRVALGRVVPASPPAGDRAAGCDCRVSGTVEVRGSGPLRGRPRVEVSLAGLPAARDTVTMFMGPPRPFDLGRVPCGRRRLEVRPLAGRRLARVAPDSTAFDCGAGGVRQFRVVLEAR